MIKIVVTGGPGTGKTTTIHELAKRGYLTIKEAARSVIEEELSITGNALPWSDVGTFQKKVFLEQLKNEEQVEKYEGIVFLDRSMIDGFAYYKLAGIVPYDKLIKSAITRKYSMIFYLEPIENYTTDNMRREDKETALKIGKLVFDIYKKLGYPIISVPAMPVEDRVNMIEYTVLKQQLLRI